MIELKIFEVPIIKSGVEFLSNILNVSKSYILWTIMFFIMSMFSLFFIFIVFCIVVSYLCIGIMPNINSKYFSLYNTNYANEYQKIYDKYGKCEIKRAYIMRKPISNFHHNVLMLITLYNWPTKSYGTLYHTGIIFEIEHNNKTKHIFIHKSTKIKITDEFKIHCDHELVPIKISKKKTQTIQEIMDITRDKLGTHDFFNWTPDNNCQPFTRVMIKAMGKGKRYDKYITQPVDYDFSYLSTNFVAVCLYLGQRCGSSVDYY